MPKTPFILYTSGSTGKPKGLVHTTGGYLVHVTSTHNYYFKQDDDDVFWCTADSRWITGHSYVVYGPLCNKQTTVICESMPLYPTPSRWWDIIDDIKSLSLLHGAYSDSRINERRQSMAQKL